MSGGWYRHDAAAGTLTVTLHVQPGARKSCFSGLHGDALRVRIAAPAVDDKANAALLEFLKEALDLPPRAAAIRHGHHARRKVVAIVNADAGLVAKLTALAATP